MEKRKKHKIKFDGIYGAIKSLKTKLEELQKWQNEKENNRGFSQGGSSVKSSSKGEMTQEEIDAQIAMIEEEINKFEEQIEDMTKEVDDIVDDLNADIFPENKSISPESENHEDLEQVAELFRKRGIDCEVKISKDGKAGIIVKERGDYEGQDLLDMSKDQLNEMIDEITDEKETKVGNEKEEKEVVTESKKEKEDEKNPKIKSPKPFSLLPGDVVEEKGEEDEDKSKGSLIAKKAVEKKDKKKPKEEKSKDEVVIPNAFESEDALNEAGIDSVAKRSKIR